MNPDQRSFHSQEFTALKMEIAALLVRIESLARYALVVSAALFSWLALQSIGFNGSSWCQKLPGEVSRLLWYVPAMFSLLSAIAALAALIRGLQMGNYVRELENALGSPDFGWENRLSQSGWFLTMVGCVYWLMLIIGTTLIGSSMSARIAEIGRICPAP